MLAHQEEKTKPSIIAAREIIKQWTAHEVDNKKVHGEHFCIDYRTFLATAAYANLSSEDVLPFFIALSQHPARAKALFFNNDDDRCNYKTNEVTQYLKDPKLLTLIVKERIQKSTLDDEIGGSDQWYDLIGKQIALHDIQHVHAFEDGIKLAFSDQSIQMALNTSDGHYHPVDNYTYGPFDYYMPLFPNSQQFLRDIKAYVDNILTPAQKEQEEKTEPVSVSLFGKYGPVKLTNLHHLISHFATENRLIHKIIFIELNSTCSSIITTLGRGYLLAKQFKLDDVADQVRKVFISNALERINKTEPKSHVSDFCIIAAGSILFDCQNECKETLLALLKMIVADLERESFENGIADEEKRGKFYDVLRALGSDYTALYQPIIDKFIALVKRDPAAALQPNKKIFSQLRGLHIPLVDQRSLYLAGLSLLTNSQLVKLTKSLTECISISEPLLIDDAVIAYVCDRLATLSDRSHLPNFKRSLVWANKALSKHPLLSDVIIFRNNYSQSREYINKVLAFDKKLHDDYIRINELRDYYVYARERGEPVEEGCQPLIQKVVDLIKQATRKDFEQVFTWIQVLNCLEIPFLEQKKLLLHYLNSLPDDAKAAAENRSKLVLSHEQLKISHVGYFFLFRKIWDFLPDCDVLPVLLKKVTQKEFKELKAFLSPPNKRAHLDRHRIFGVPDTKLTPKQEAREKAYQEKMKKREEEYEARQAKNAAAR